jgi:hypothetical protein
VDAALGAVAARRDLDGAVASASATEVVVQEADAAGAAAAVKALATAYDTCAATRRVGGIAVERLTARESTDHGATFRTLRSDTDTQGVGNLEYAGWRVAGADLVYVVVRYHGHGDILGEAAVGQALARAAVRWQGGDPGPDVTVTPVPAPSATTGRRPPQLAAPAFPIRSLTSP